MTYTSLFFTFVSLMYLKNPNNINYFALPSILNDSDYRTEFKKYLQNEYISKNKDYKDILNYEIAILNNNQEINPDYYQSPNFTLQSYCHIIRENIFQFKVPIFYFLHIYDPNQNLFGSALNHMVGLYLLSPTEIHIFDANNGINILYLPQEIISSDLENNISRFLFKNNFIDRLLINPNSESMVFNLLCSTPNPNLNERAKKIKDYLTILINSPTFKINPDSIDEKEKNFLKMNTYVINKFQNYKKPEYVFGFFNNENTSSKKSGYLIEDFSERKNCIIS